MEPISSEQWQIDHSKPWLKANLAEATLEVATRPVWMNHRLPTLPDNMLRMTRRFPLNVDMFPGIPINAHPGAFGCARKHNFHEGIDLYGKPGQWVHAFRAGKVISNLPFTGPSVGHDWWLPTNAVLVKDEDGYWVYGELTSTLKEGDVIESGDLIGKLTPVLPDSKLRLDIPGHSVTMLHLERWDNTYDPSTGWSSWNTRESRPKYLQDPTLPLVDILQSKKLFFKFLTL